MKEYFKKSPIYQKFVQEQETEAKNKQECETVSKDLAKMKENYMSLEEDVKKLEEEIAQKQKEKDSKTIQQFEKDQEKNFPSNKEIKNPERKTVMKFRQPVQQPEPKNATDIGARWFAQKKPEEKLITDINHVYGLKQPLTHNHMYDDSDFKNNYNPSRRFEVVESKQGSLSQRKGPQDLVPPPSDKQYEEPEQLKQPLTDVHMGGEHHDLRNVYNPNKKGEHYKSYNQMAEPVVNKTVEAFVQSKAEPKKNATSLGQPANKTTQALVQRKEDLVPAPRDHQYEMPAQLQKPLIFENSKSTDDFRHVYNPSIKPNPHEYVAINPSKPEGLVPPPKDH